MINLKQIKKDYDIKLKHGCQSTLLDKLDYLLVIKILQTLSQFLQLILWNLPVIETTIANVQLFDCILQLGILTLTF